MVAIKDGRPNLATSTPFKTPMAVDTHKAPSKAITELPVEKNMNIKIIAERPIIEGKDMSKSPLMTINVSDIERMSIIGVKDSKAEYKAKVEKAAGSLI
jgi:hypothetical protein